MRIERGIAIDWGNTNTVVMVRSGDRIESLMPGGTPLIPSYIQYDRDGQVVQIGWGAKNALRIGQPYVVMGTKRLLGRAWDSVIAVHIQKVYGLETQKGPHGEIVIRVGPNLALSVQQIARDFFAAIKKMIVQTYPEDQLPPCIATCPVQYLEPHKAELLQILQEAGFVIWEQRLLPEAQAVCFLLPSQQNELTLVVDWGGGTLDLAIVSEGRCLRLDGIEYGCGGGDMDIAILNALENTNRIPPLGGVDRAVVREWIESRKERVLALPNGEKLPPEQVQLPLREQEVVLNFQQEEVLEWIRPILIRSLNAIRSSYWPYRQEVRQCLLVGGPFQAPCIVQEVQGILPPKCKFIQLPPLVSPSTAVATGALAAFREYRSILVHDYGVAIDCLDHLLGTILLQRGQECPVESPVEILRPRGIPGTWVDVVVFVRRADLSEHKYIYETSERFRILPQFDDQEAELEVQLIADPKGIVSLHIFDRKAQQSMRLPNLGQQLSHPLDGPPYRSDEEAIGAWLKRLWEKYLYKVAISPRGEEDPFSPSLIQIFLQQELEGQKIIKEDLQTRARTLGEEILSWINRYLGSALPGQAIEAIQTLRNHLQALGSSLCSDAFFELLRDFLQNVQEILALVVRQWGTVDLLPQLQRFRTASPGQSPEVPILIHRLPQILSYFTGSEEEYRVLLNLLAELQAHLQNPSELRDCFWRIHQIIQFRYQMRVLESHMDQNDLHGG